MGNGAGSNSYEWISHDYAASRGGSARVEQIRHAVEPLLLPDSRVLDVGAGPGELARRLVDSGHDAVAVDLSFGMCRLAQALRIVTVCAHAEALPFPSSSFDHVLFVWSLNHVGSPDRALSEATRVVSIRGSIVIVSGIPSHPSWDSLGSVISRLDALRPSAVVFQQLLDSLPTWDGWAVERAEDMVITFRQRATGLADRVEGRLYGHLRNVLVSNDLVTSVVDELRSIPMADAYRLRQNRHAVYVLRHTGGL